MIEVLASTMGLRKMELGRERAQKGDKRRDMRMEVLLETDGGERPWA